MTISVSKDARKMANALCLLALLARGVVEGLQQEGAPMELREEVWGGGRGGNNKIPSL